ncbi:MAG TPA: cell division protein ZapA [Firmicutes bacterium]|nr:cell division protein ZapA [Bacillota bacterium]
MAETAGSGSRLHRVRVVIAGDEYTLRTDEPVKQVEKLAARVDRELSELQERFPGVVRERLAVLLALRLMAQLERAREQSRSARKAAQAEAAAAAEPAAGPAVASASAATPSRQTGEREETAAGQSLFDPPQGDPAL